MKRNIPIALLLIVTALLNIGCSNQGESVFAEGPRRIIVISLDCLRADHLGCYGYDRNISPFLDSMAAGSTLFTRTTAPANWTLPSHTSLFTGLFPSKHRVVHKQGVLSESIGSLVEPLQDAGFATGAFTGGAFLRAKHGHDRGFDHYWEANKMSGAWTETLERATSWLETNQTRDTFLFLHTYEIHMPYTPPRNYVKRVLGTDQTRFRGSIRNMIDLEKQETISDQDVREVMGHYDAGIAYTDDMLGVWWQKLETAGLTDNLLLIISSDHGDAFWEHGKRGHGKDNLEAGVSDIPLLVKLPSQSPGQGGTTSDLESSFLDIMPTVLDAAGLDRPENLDGYSLMPAVTGGKIRGADARARLNRSLHEEGDYLLSIIEGEHYDAIRGNNVKVFIEKNQQGESDIWPAIYNLETDPGEHQPLPPTGALFSDFDQALRRILGGNRPVIEELDESTLDAETRRQLEALGYL
jgi:arylsulfatase A-like enzyme